MARTIRREEVAFPSAPDPRFGGNLARATEGAQYSRAFPGGPPGVDRRYENYQAPHRVDYTSPQGGTYPHELRHQGKSTYPHELQHQGMPRQHPNPRMRGIGGGGGGLESLQSKVNLQEIAENDPFDPSRLGIGDPFNNQIFTDPFDPRRLGIEEEPFDPFNPPGWTEPEPYDPFNNQLGGLQEQAAVDPSDWRTILRILEAGGDPGTETQTAYNVGDTYPLEGHGRRRPYGGTRDMGPTYEELETIPLDLQFDQWGYPIGQDDWGYIGAARGGLMSLRR